MESDGSTRGAWATRARGLGRRLFYRSAFFRRVAVASRLPALPERPPKLTHLALFSETSWGPVQRDEALLLYALVRVLRPRTVLEIGFLKGRSALNFLAALDADARLYSIDVDPAQAARAQRLLGHDARFAFKVLSQDAVSAEVTDNRPADLVFLDASHDLELNQATFERLLAVMAPDAVLAIHDTGAIPRELVPEGHWWLQSDAGWIGDQREVRPDERAFVNWIRERHPEFEQLHLHSRQTMRLGLTLLQRGAPLPTTNGPQR